MKWLIAYDIADTRRLQKIHRHLCNCAFPLQNSVFLLSGRPEDFARCRDKLLTLIHPREDDLRIYALDNRSPIRHFGQNPLPDGIVWRGAEITPYPNEYE